MKKIRQNGFVLILVIAAMTAIGAVMLVLTSIANTMLFESDTAYLQAIERNLLTSGLAWAGQNIRSGGRETFNRPIELDITDMNVSDSTLTVTIGIPRAKEAQVQVNTSCSRGRRTLRYSNKYHIEL